MTETLYRLTLSYLRQNHHLINFIKLNHQACKDLYKVIKDKNYISNVLTCRVVHNWRAIDSYLAKYYPTSKYFTFLPFVENSNTKKSEEWINVDRIKIITGAMKSYINDIYVNVGGKYIYDTSTDIKYKFHDHKTVSKFGYKICDEATKKIIVADRYDTAFVYDNELFNKLPKDLIIWAIENDYLSDPIIINRKFLKRK